MKATAIPVVTVSSDHEEIRVMRPGHEPNIMRWSDVSIVQLTTSADGGETPRLDWVIRSRGDRASLSIPFDAAGEHDLLMTMQVRLPGFDRMAVIEALSAPDSAEFEIWNADWPEQ